VAALRERRNAEYQRLFEQNMALLGETAEPTGGVTEVATG
jgi:hypothetical protein